MFTILTGYKTYLIAAAIFALGGFKALGWVDDNTYTTVVTLLGPLGLVTLRGAVDRK